MDMIHYRKNVVHLGRTPGEFSKCPIVTLLINRPSQRSSTLPQVALHSRCICNPGAQPERWIWKEWGSFWWMGNRRALSSTKGSKFSLWDLEFEGPYHLEGWAAAEVVGTVLWIAVASLFGRERRVQKINLVPFGKGTFQVNGNREGCLGAEL